MRLLVVGGKLQGTEALYLASKAGYETILVDHSPECPAAGLADRVVAADVTADERITRSLVAACDAVLPACEDAGTLEWLAERLPGWGVPLLFDRAAYRVTRSKTLSRDLFDALDVPRPRSWPDCGFPVIVKPDAGSGSQGVATAGDETMLADARRNLKVRGQSAVVEEFVSGPSLSLEVVALAGQAVTLQVTGLEFDTVYDCKRVVAPVGVASSPPHARQHAKVRSGHWQPAVEQGVGEHFAELGRRLARGLSLNGVMDVEVIVRDRQELVVLEVDARLPSQTPTAVLWSSGQNMVEALVDMRLRGVLPSAGSEPPRGCVYQHVQARDGRLSVVGEHAMASARPLRLVPGFFGAQEALTDKGDPNSPWVATVITTGVTLDEAQGRGRDVIEAIAGREGLQLEAEQTPFEYGASA